ncbi:MAG: hypothetical protein KAU35_08560 [candidate division Zixibacteria bacterium]|nr:hypothetical protein [candidate division Zixibacteria bacterium]
MKTLAAIITIALTAVLIFSCTGGEKKISLRFKYEPGMTLGYEQTTKRTWKAVAGDSVMEEGHRTYSVELRASVIDLSKDGIAELLDSTTWTYTAPGKEDSTALDTVESLQVTRTFVKPNGRISDVIYPSDKDVSSITWLKNYYEQGMPVFPPGELSPGYSWTQTTRVLLPDETMNALTTYKVKSLAREAGYDCAVIEFTGNMIIPVEPGKEKDGDCIRRGHDQIDVTGVSYFAYKEGIVVLERHNWELAGHREKVCKGETTEYLVMSQSQIEFRLVSFLKP